MNQRINIKSPIELKDYIAYIGHEAASILFDSKPDTVKSWRYGMRQPSLKQAKIIIENTAGKIDFEGIYGPDVVYRAEQNSD